MTANQLRRNKMHNKRNEKVIRKMFKKQSCDITDNIDKFIKTRNNIKIGLESEVSVFREDISIDELGQIRNEIIKEVENECYDMELGVTQIEFRTPPVCLNGNRHGFKDLSVVYKENFEKLLKIARQKNVSILRIGSNPFFPITNTPRTNKMKYKIVPDYHNYYRQKMIETKIGTNGLKIEAGDAAIVSLFQSFQINVEAKSLDDSIDKMNRSFMIGPYILALSGNSRYLELKDTGFNDVRFPAWEISHDTRKTKQIMNDCNLRVGLPNRYFVDIADYFRRIQKFPFMLFDAENAFKIGIGLTWMDTRVKFIDNSAVVEFRLIPTQPNIEDEIALAEFYVGRLTYSQVKNEILLPLSLVRENRFNCFHYGIKGNYWYISDEGVIRKDKGRHVLGLETKRAEIGLKFASLSSGSVLEKIFTRLDEGSPSDNLCNLLKKQVAVDKKEMVYALTSSKMLI